MLVGTLVLIAQVVLQLISIASHADSSVPNSLFVRRVHISAQEVRMSHHHIAVYKQQPRHGGLFSQIVADGSTPGILGSLNVATVGIIVDSPVGFDS